MSDEKKKYIGAYLPEGLIKAFKDYVVQEYGQLRYYFSKEVEKALEEYLHTRREEQHHHLSGQDYKESLRADRRRRLERAKKAVLNEHANREYIRGSHMRAILANSTGCKDPRPLKRYLEDLVLRLGVIDCHPYRKLGDFDTERYVIRGG